MGAFAAPGVTATTLLESWSVGKSLVATLIGRLIQQGAEEVDVACLRPLPASHSPVHVGSDAPKTLRYRRMQHLR